MASELKPCPFCGGTDVNLHHSAKTFMSWVSCKSCGLDAPSETGVTDEEAITYWNTRPAPAATDTGLVTVMRRYRGTDWPDHYPWAFLNESDCQGEPGPRWTIEKLCLQSQAEEILAAKDAEREAIMQAITDPENQPSKFGTVTIAFFNEKIAAKNARVKTLEQVNAKLCDDVIDYELKIAERDVSLNELKQKLADKFSFTSDDDALAVLERYGHKETGNGIIKADMRALDDMCRAAVAYLCAEWDFVFQDEVELNREALEAKLAAAHEALEPFADHANDRAVDDTGWRDKETVKIVVSIGDLRKARTVLGGKP